MLPMGVEVLLLCACGPGHPALIPRDLLFGPPDREQVALSPDGSRLAFVAPLDGVKCLWVAPADAPRRARVVVPGAHRIGAYRWAFAGYRIVYEATQADESSRVWCVDTETLARHELTPGEGVSASILDVGPVDPHHVLLLIREPAGALPNVYRVELGTGRRELVAHNDGFAGWLVGPDGTLAVALKLTSEGALSCLTRAGDGRWRELLTIRHEDLFTTGPVSIDAEGLNLYLRDSRGRDTAALVRLNVVTGETTVLGGCSTVDVERVLTDPQTGVPDAYACDPDRLDWHPLSPDTAAHLERLARSADGPFDVVSRSLDCRRWAISRSVKGGPSRYYLYDADTGRERLLFSERTQLSGRRLAQTTPLVIRSGDGLDLVSYLTLPQGVLWEPGQRPPIRRLPLVLRVHGGPWLRERLGYDAWAQWLANRGYAVLTVNFRGSTGFGKAFANAGNREWGRKMHDDLMDARAWAVGAGIADPSRVGIMGGSYGGYATLMALALAPDAFACGIDIVGPVNLITLLESLPATYQAKMEFWKRAVGDPGTPEGRAELLAVSPITHVHRIRSPLLIAHGGQDPRCKRTQSDEIVAALQQHGVPVVYVLYPDEGHGFERTENKTSFFAVAELFLARYLGGRCEPLGRSLVGSSIQVPVGRELLPEVAAALAEGVAQTASEAAP